MITGQNISIVSSFPPGTTTDPVKKIGGNPGYWPGNSDRHRRYRRLRGGDRIKKIRKSQEVIRRVDCAILLIAGNQFGDYEVRLIEQFKRYDVPTSLPTTKAI